MTLLSLIISVVAIFLTMTLFWLGIAYIGAWGGSSIDERKHRHLLIGIVITVGSGYLCVVFIMRMFALLNYIFTKII